MYYVADIDGSDCGTLACENGVAGTCNRNSDGDWVTEIGGKLMGRKVICDTGVSNFAGDVYFEDSALAGTYGGSCTCPTGEVYQVGNIGGDCSSLACEGGVPGICHEYSGEWSN